MRFFMFFFLIPAIVSAGQFPFIEKFDTVQIPRLPAGWSTTTNRLSTGDFVTTTSSPYSDSNAVLSTNSTISQSLITPVLDFSDRDADSIFFFERRSTSHTSIVLLEASVDGGSSFPILISDSMKNPGTSSYIQRKYKLPGSLSGRAGVQIRWRILGNGAGTTGTYRLDDICITARAEIDAEIFALRFLPLYPNAGDTVSIIAVVRNAGTRALQNLQTSFYLDSNGDSIPQPEELISTYFFSGPLNPADTAAVSASVPGVELGSHVCIARVEMDGDQDSSNNTSHAVLSVGMKKNSVVVNEIMYAPPTGEPEWVELFNATAVPADLKNWKISNRNSTTRYMLSPLSAELEPRGFIVITKDSASFRGTHPAFSGNLLQVSAMPTSLFNNTGDAVVIFDARGSIMDSVRYVPSWGGSGGKSLERIEPGGSSLDSANWGPSGDSSGSSPGAQNYLTPLEHNLRLDRVSTTNGSGCILLSVTICNIGRNPEFGFSISLFHDLNDDSIPEPGELIQSQTLPFILNPKDSAHILFTWGTPPYGEQEIIARLDDSVDMRSSDNLLRKTVSIPFPLRSLVINEIMYNPLKNGSEYVELLNISSSAVDVCRWKLSDRKDTNQSSATNMVTCNRHFLGSRKFLVVASDSSILDRFSYLHDTSAYAVVIRHGTMSLNNSGDNVILSDLTGLTIDSVYYHPSWNNPDIDDPTGRSLERISPQLGSNDPRNWSTCTNPLGGTPGNQNSIYTLGIASNAELSCFPNPFSPDGDGHEDMTIIHFRLPATTAAIRMRIYDAAGRLIRTLADGEPSGACGEVAWNGYTDSGNRARMGIYIVLIDAVDARGKPLSTAKSTVVVAAKL